MSYSLDDIEKLPQELQVPIMLSKLLTHVSNSVVSLQCILHLCPERKEEVLKYLITEYSITSKAMPKIKKALNTIEKENNKEKNKQVIWIFMREFVLEAQSATDNYLTGTSDNEEKRTH